MARTFSKSSGDAGANSKSPLVGFRSTGLHVLEPYISPVVRSGTAVCTSTSSKPQDRASAAQPQGPGASRQSTVWEGHIPADNLGFRLLRKSGWRVGAGLGAGEQGRRDPIEPELPKGTRGLGFDPRAAQQQQQQQGQQQQQQGRKRAAGDEPEAPGRRSRTTDAVAELVREELARETLSDKVARHKQLMRAEREQERGRAIERYLRAAFNDPFDHLHSDNSNPLSRPHRLTQGNPLLDPIGED